MLRYTNSKTSLLKIWGNIIWKILLFFLNNKWTKQHPESKVTLDVFSKTHLNTYLWIESKMAKTSSKTKLYIFICFWNKRKLQTLTLLDPKLLKLCSWKYELSLNWKHGHNSKWENKVKWSKHTEEMYVNDHDLFELVRLFVASVYRRVRIKCTACVRSYVSVVCVCVYVYPVWKYICRSGVMGRSGLSWFWVIREDSILWTRNRLHSSIRVSLTSLLKNWSVFLSFTLYPNYDF